MAELLGWLVIGGGVWAYFAVKRKIAREEAATRAAARQAEVDLLLSHPEAWKAREAVRIEHARMAAQQRAEGESAAKEAEQEKARRNAALIAEACRRIGGW